MARRKLLSLNTPVVTSIPTQPITWHNWRRGMGDGAERFLEIISIVTRQIAEASIRPGGPSMSVMLNEPQTLIGVLEVMKELHPHLQIRISVGIRPMPDSGLADEYSVADLMAGWNELTPFSRLHYLCRCYRALFDGKSSLAVGSTHHISLDAVIAIAGLYGIAVGR